MRRTQVGASSRTGVSRTGGRPARVVLTSSPASSRATSADSCLLAWCRLTIGMWRGETGGQPRWLGRPGATGHDGAVTAPRNDAADVDLAQLTDHLRNAGAVFAYLHGSRVSGTARPDSDLDVAAWFGRKADSWVVAGPLPGVVDLLVLDTAPLELAGRVAMHGRLLFEADPAVRINWEATTRKIYLDEQPRRDQARRDFAQAHRRG